MNKNRVPVETNAVIPYASLPGSCGKALRCAVRRDFVVPGSSGAVGAERRDGGRAGAATREQLLAAVWQGEPDSDNVVAVYVGYVRQKLEAAGESRLLHTIRGAGYSLRED